MKKSVIFAMLGVIVLLVLGLLSGMEGVAWAQEPYDDPTSCDVEDCHKGIEPIRDPETSLMMERLDEKGGCVVCHGGDPEETEDADKAHSGDFYPDPGSLWTIDKTCGQASECHADYWPYAMERALMNTEAGKIQGNLWAWGEYPSGRKVVWGNYDVDDPDGTVPIAGTDVYKGYMALMRGEHPDQYPDSLEMLPEVSVEEIVADPAKAGFTYQRQQCQRCHVGVKGRSKRGDWRGLGCSACHIPYGNEGIYEGGDEGAPMTEEGKPEVGHLLLHEIQNDREARMGIPIETCNSCHNRGKRIGVTYQGLMEFPYGSPWTEAGETQPKLHTKKYLFIKEDLHHEMESREENPEGRMICQDCHTTIDMHGDGNVFGTTLSQVEIECADCHGTPDSYPWELPIGYQEEFEQELEDEPRGTTNELAEFMDYGIVYDPEDGYLLTARGNPFGNVVRQGDKVIVHSATGVDFESTLLKTIKAEGNWKTQNAEVAMDKVTGHLAKTECYACHADWAPQCYGCHVKADYGPDKTDTDWVATGNTRSPTGLTAEADPDVGAVKSPGKISEKRSYLRWEEPVLGVNGEGRVSPLMPGCQVVFTVVDPDGKTIALNQIARTPPNTEGGGAKGQRGMDMAPVQPHSAGRVARRCESCHSSEKAMGYGIQGGRYQLKYPADYVIDLQDAQGNIIPRNTKVQIAAVPDLPMDLSQIVDRNGNQLQTVGSHWDLSRPMDQEMRDRMERTGVCMGCHQNMPKDSDFWQEKVIKKYGEVLTDTAHIEQMNKLLQDAVAAAPAEAAAAPAEPMAAEEKIAAAEEEAAAAKATATAAEVKLLEMEEAQPAPNVTLYAIVALVVGLVVGGGAIYFTRKS